MCSFFFVYIYFFAYILFDIFLFFGIFLWYYHLHEQRQRARERPLLPFTRAVIGRLRDALRVLHAFGANVEK